MTLYAGQSIGLLGGSFNPAHKGHMHVALCGLRQLQLDHIWWMTSPQNPLKKAQPAYEKRAASVTALGLPYRMRLTHIERKFNTHYTIDLIRTIQNRMPDTRFVFLMGADNFAQLPQWKDWQMIMKRLPIAVIARPGMAGRTQIRPRLGRAARQFSQARMDENQASFLQYSSAPAWTYLTPPLNGLSSTKLRNIKNGHSQTDR